MNNKHLFFSLIFVLIFCSCSDKNETEESNSSVVLNDSPYTVVIPHATYDGVTFKTEGPYYIYGWRDMPSGGKLRTIVSVIDDKETGRENKIVTITWQYDIWNDLYSTTFSEATIKSILENYTGIDDTDSKKEIYPKEQSDVATIEKIIGDYFEKLNTFLHPKWKEFSPSGIEHSAEVAPVALVELTISKDGRITAATFDKSSGNEQIDTATKKFLSVLSDVPKPPFELVVSISLTYYDRFF